MDTIHDEGWVWLWRKSIDSQVFQNEGLWKVWTWCLMKANHKDAWVPVRTGRGTTEVLVKRGQFIFGRKTAGKELKMKGTTVQYRMQKLENMRNLVTQPNTHYSIITICNYEPYQSTKRTEPTPNPSTIRQPSVTNNNDKNIKNKIGRSKKQIDPRVKEFENYWSEIFQKEIDKPYLFNFGKDGKLIKNLLQVYPLETLQEMTRIFFKDEQCKRRGLTIGIFNQEIIRLFGLKAMNPLEQARRELQRG